VELFGLPDGWIGFKIGKIVGARKVGFNGKGIIAPVISADLYKIFPGADIWKEIISLFVSNRLLIIDPISTAVHYNSRRTWTRP
jgi:hypothetical protein